MNYQWQVNTMLGSEHELQEEMQSGKRHRRDSSRKPKYKPTVEHRCRELARWCTKCCRGQEGTLGDSTKSDTSYFKRRRLKKKRKSADEEEQEIEVYPKQQYAGVSEESSELSSIPSSVPDQVSEEETAKKKRKGSNRWSQKRRKSKEDSSSKGSVEAETAKREREMEILEALPPEIPYHRPHKHHRHSRDEKKRKSHDIHEESYPTKEEKRIKHRPRMQQDIKKSCCYLCVRNTMAIAAAEKKRADQSVQISTQTMSIKKVGETCDKSCSPILNMRTVQSSVKVKTRDRSTACPESKKKEKRKHKYKRFGIFPKVKLTKCPATNHVACETDTCVREDDKRTQNHERCCGEKKQSHRKWGK